MVHNDGPQWADTTTAAKQESAAGQGFLIAPRSLGSNPSSRRQIYVIFFASGFGNLTNLKFKYITNWPVAARPNESSGS
jgi:hypothetical protein